MKKRHVIGLLVLSVALSHALAPAIAWAQFKVQNAFYSLTVTDTVTASGDVTADQYIASGSASQYSCSKTDGTCQFSSATADGTTSSTVGSFTFKAGANIADTDLLLDIQNSAAGHVLTLNESGSIVLPATQSIKIGSYFFSNAETGRWYLGSANGVGDGIVNMGSTSLSGAASQITCSATNATCQMLSSTADSTTSGTVGALTLKASTDITASDLLLDVQDSAGAHAFTVTEAGAATALSTITSSAGSNSVALQTTLGAYIALSASNLVRSNPSTGGVEIQAASGAYLFPYADNTIDIGKSGNTWKDVWLSGDIRGDASVRGTCTLDGASPSKCTATVTAAALCTCSIVGTTAAIAAKGCAVSLSSTTLTITSANGAGEAVNYHCIL